MKKTVTHKFFGGGKYHSPEIEVFESVVERGFQVSEEYFIDYGDPNSAGNPFKNENGDGGWNDFGSF